MTKISFIVVAYNAAQSLDALLGDLLSQTIAPEQLEALLVDSASTDDTAQIMRRFAARAPFEVKLLENPKRWLASGINVALRAATGDAVIRLDAHARMPKDFLQKNLDALARGEDIVGGSVCGAPPETAWEAVTRALDTSRFCGGAAPFRNGGEARYVDTLAYALYRREVYDRVGLYDERLRRTEDNDMHYRMRKAGYRFYFSPDIVSWHAARKTLRGQLSQKWGNGYWIGRTMRIQPRCFAPRHLVPALFVLALGWGVMGSALATVLGWACSCLAVLQYFCLRSDVPMRLRLPAMRLSFSMDRTVLAFGLPSFCVQAGMAIVNFVINFQLVRYGAATPIGADDALAAIGVVQRIGQFSVMPLIGIAIALQPLLGFNYGAHNVERVRKTLWYGIGAASSISLLMFVIVEVFAVPIAHAFGISHDGLVDFTAFAIRVQFLMLPFVGFQIVSSNYFQATGQPAKSVFLTLTRQILFLVPLLYLMPVVLPQLFPQFTGLDALYFAAPVADFLSIFTTAVFVAWEMARLRRLSAMYA